MENVKRGNVSANRDSWVQTAVNVHKELSVIKVSESALLFGCDRIRDTYLKSESLIFSSN